MVRVILWTLEPGLPELKAAVPSGQLADSQCLGFLTVKWG